jgi:transposase InsO family protein
LPAVAQLSQGRQVVDRLASWGKQICARARLAIGIGSTERDGVVVGDWNHRIDLLELAQHLRLTSLFAVSHFPLDTFATFARDPARRTEDRRRRDRARLTGLISLAPVRLCQEGFLYLGAVQDAFSRAIVGWSMADHMR